MYQTAGSDLTADAGLTALCLVARYLGIAADPEEMARRFVAGGAAPPRRT